MDESLQNKDFNIKVTFCLVGEAGVGKTCTILNWSRGEVNHSYTATIGCEFFTRTLKIKNDIVKVEIWDTSGAERFRSLTRSYYRNTIGALIFYDITNEKTFEKVPEWQEEIKKNSHEEIQLLLIGNKVDKESERQVSYAQGSQYAEENGMKFLECCAFDIKTVEPAFNYLLEQIIFKMDMGDLDPNNETLGIKLQGTRSMSSKKNTTSVNINDPAIGGQERKKCCNIF